jgi:hypothetical protein
MGRSICCAVVLILSLCTASAAATTTPVLAVLPVESQGSITYAFAMPGGNAVEGNGGTIVLQRTDDSTLAVTVTTPGSDRLSYKGTIRDDGTVDIGAVRPWLTALNEVIAISRDATANPTAGQMWTSSATLEASSGDASVDVPLKVLVASRAVSGTGEQVQLMAAGGLHAVVRETTSVASPRVTLYLQLAGQFLNGSLQNASGNMSATMINGANTKDPGENPTAWGSTVQGGANGGGIGWTLTLVPAPAASPSP